MTQCSLTVLESEGSTEDVNRLVDRVEVQEYEARLDDERKVVGVVLGLPLGPHDER